MARFGVPGGGGKDIKVVRQSTGSVSGGASANVTCTFAEAFPDTNYTVIATCHGPANEGSDLTVQHIPSKTASQIVVRVTNNSAIGARTANVNVIAIAD